MNVNAAHHSPPLARFGVPRLILALGILLIAFSAVPSGASAALVWLEHEPDESSLGYAGQSGERNFVTAELSGGEFLFTESGGPTISSFPTSVCQRVSPVQVRCSTTNSRGIPWENLHFELNDGDDLADVRVSTPSILNGGGGADVLKGGSGPDEVRGDGDFHAVVDPGSDTLNGRGGADDMRGNLGNDTATYAGRTSAVNVSLDAVANDGGPGEGDDVDVDVENVVGGEAADKLTGNGAANLLSGGPGADDIDGLGGADDVRGGDGNDALEGGSGDDELSGQTGNDTLRGEAGGDRLLGGPSDDGLIPTSASTSDFAGDFMSGGDGIDHVDYRVVTAAVRVTLDQRDNDGVPGETDTVRADVENAFTGPGDDLLVGGDSQNELYAGAGDDRILGGEHDDRLDGEAGNDTLEGGYNGDVMVGGPGQDTVDYAGHSYTDFFTGEVVGVDADPGGGANDGNPEIDASAVPQARDEIGTDVENIDGSEGPDLLVGDGAANRLRGGAGDDRIFGGAQDDRLNGQEGDDLLEGGYNGDWMVGGPGQADTVDYAGHSYTDGFTGEVVGVDATVAGGAANDGNHLIDASGEIEQALDRIETDVENIDGSEGPDLLVGDGDVNRLTGGAEDDTLDGHLGSDTLAGQGGTDTISYAGRTAAQPVAVSLDQLRNDGADPNGDGISTAAEEGDRGISVENATGGRGDDTLTATTANAVVNVLAGGGGADSLDTLDGTATIDRLLCGTGIDGFRKDSSDTQFDCETALP